MPINPVKYITSFGVDGTNDYITAIAIGAASKIYIGGYTESENFPTLDGAYKTYEAGGANGYISLMHGDMDRLESSTFVGSSNVPFYLYDLLYYSSGVFICGNETDIDGALVVAKFNAALSSRSALEESLTGIPTCIAVDSDGNIFVGGYTKQTSSFATTGAYQEACGGLKRGFIIKLSSTDLSILAATFLGPTNTADVETITQVLDIDIDSNDNVFVTGITQDVSTFPTTTGAYQEEQDQSVTNAAYAMFVSKLDNDLATLSASTLYSSKYGVYSSGDPFEDNYGTIARSLVVLPDDTVMVAGDTQSHQLTGIASTSYQNSSNQARQGILTRFSNDLDDLLYATYLWGTDGRTYLTDVCSEPQNQRIFVNGYTTSTELPMQSFSWRGADNFAGYSSIKYFFTAIFNVELTRLEYLSYASGSRAVD